MILIKFEWICDMTAIPKKYQEKRTKVLGTAFFLFSPPTQLPEENKIFFGKQHRINMSNIESFLFNSRFPSKSFSPWLACTLFQGWVLLFKVLFFFFFYLINLKKKETAKVSWKGLLFFFIGSKSLPSFYLLFLLI